MSRPPSQFDRIVKAERRRERIDTFAHVTAVVLFACITAAAAAITVAFVRWVL